MARRRYAATEMNSTEGYAMSTAEKVELFPTTGLTQKVMLVSPRTAQKWLDQNTINRNVRRTHVDYLAKCIRDGDWQVTHQGIAIAKTGKLLDGQHRLQAIVESGISVYMMVTWGLDEDAFSAIDAQSLPRNMADITGISRKELEYARFGLRLLMVGQYKFTPSQTVAAHAALLPYIQAIEGASQHKVRVLTATPVKYAAMLRYAIESPGGRDYIINLYKNIVSQRFDALPPVGHAFMRKVLNHDLVITGGSGQHQPLVNAWYLYNPEKRDMTKITFKDEAYRKASGEIKEWTKILIDGTD